MRREGAGGAAISLLSDHLHRNPSDLEAHNLLLQCFYETDRHEVSIYRFRKLTRSPLFISDDPIAKKPPTINKFIITFGREGYQANDIQVAGSTSVSHRHCVVVNCRDDVWLYDLESTGAQVNGERVKGKMPLIGRNIVHVGSKEFVITNDKDSLI